MIRIYGKKDCSYCKYAVNLMEQLGWWYEYFEVPTDISIEDLKSLVGKKPGDKITVPQIFRGTLLIGGYTEFLDYVEQVSGGYGEGQL